MQIYMLLLFFKFQDKKPPYIYIYIYYKKWTLKLYYKKYMTEKNGNSLKKFIFFSFFVSTMRLQAAAAVWTRFTSCQTDLNWNGLLPAGVDHLAGTCSGHAWARAGVGLPGRRRWWGLAGLFRPLLDQTISWCWLGGSLGGSLQCRFGWFLHHRLREFLRLLLDCFVGVKLWLSVFWHTKYKRFSYIRARVCVLDLHFCLICTCWWLHRFATFCLFSSGSKGRTWVLLNV